MYDYNKRSYFTHLGELRMLLADLPDETEVCTLGILGTYLHFTEDGTLISFDDDNLEGHCAYTDDAIDNYNPPSFNSKYPEYADDDGYIKKQLTEDDEYNLRQQWIDEGPQFIVVGNKLMRTFLADDGSWDYELYDVNA